MHSMPGIRLQYQWLKSWKNEKKKERNGIKFTVVFVRLFKIDFHNVFEESISFLTWTFCWHCFKQFSSLCVLISWENKIFTHSRHRRQRVLSSFHASACPYVCASIRLSVPNDVTAPTLFKDFSYLPEIWWDDAQYHETDYYLKWPYWPIFVRSSENFHDWLGHGLRDNATALTL